ncbi:hypothetical protein SLNWT_1288 [Streptomyces albus]|uniref:Uncharacterized protein n=1 Tax=Streptomyces albus (strain ATCC 21838 / DSM 41398 / FERM P-419 / JCM 4703 / NBRC 107858) TaxID=1081613 RepID=A0A0B5EJI8_STRA4|nr:hypothetical protein SLNWT_1288 [Streptomyces albus]AOU75980.1 hypothetical protein SLNHY_1289 [Streptomyces albus]
MSHTHTVALAFDTARHERADRPTPGGERPYDRCRSAAASGSDDKRPLGRKQQASARLGTSRIMTCTTEITSRAGAGDDGQLD